MSGTPNLNVCSTTYLNKKCHSYGNIFASFIFLLTEEQKMEWMKQLNNWKKLLSDKQKRLVSFQMPQMTPCKTLPLGLRWIAGIPQIFENVRIGLRLHSIPFFFSDDFTKVLMVCSCPLSLSKKTVWFFGMILVN